MPAIPDKTGGAGKGSFIIENNNPTMVPAKSASKTSVINSPLVVFTFKILA